jgi:hypothetical protein
MPWREVCYILDRGKGARARGLRALHRRIQKIADLLADGAVQYKPLSVNPSTG